MEDRRVLVILADGFEEIEALAPIDVLRRCGATVTIAGLGSGSIRGAHDVHVKCDCILDDTLGESFDAIVLPGGMPGAKNLRDSETVRKLILDTYGRGDLVCAICASPAFVLGPTGILEGRAATCYPGCEGVAPSVRFKDVRTVRDGNVITAQGPGTALEFALLIAKALFGDEAEKRIHDDMICM